MGPTNIKFVGTPCGQHGPYTFYKAFKFKKDFKTNLLSLGEFFFIKIFKDVEVCIGELQLLWEDRYNPGSLLAMVRLYFLPEQTPDGRKNSHGEDEVLMEQDKVPFLLDDLVTLLADEIEWTAGSRALCGEGEVQTPTTTPPVLKSKALDVLKSFDSNNKGLDMREINQERKLLEEEDSYGSKVVILNYTQYCRFRSMSKRLEGCHDTYLRSVVVGAMGGYITLLPHTRVLFCRDMFEHPVIQEHEMRQDHLAPNLRGRPKKKRLSFRKYEKDHVYSNESDSNDSLSSERSSARSTPQKFRDHTNTSPLPLKTEALLVKPEAVSKNTVKPTPIKPEPNNHSVATKNKSNSTLSKKQRLREERLEDAVDISIFKPASREGMGRDEERFLKKLGLFMKRHSIRLSRLPTLGFKPVDLFQFFIRAQKIGGYQQVTEKRKWKQIYDELGGSAGNTSAATCTRRHYEKLLLPFEKYQKGEKPNGPQNIITKPRKLKTEDSENGQPVINRTDDGSTAMFVKKKIKDLVHKEPLKEVKQEENDSEVKRETCEEVSEDIKPPTSTNTPTLITTTTTSPSPTTSANQDRPYIHTANQSGCNNENVLPTSLAPHTVTASSQLAGGSMSSVITSTNNIKVNHLPQSSAGLLQIRPSATNVMSQNMRPAMPGSKDSGMTPMTPVLRQPMVNVRHNLIPGFRLPKTSIAAVLPQPPVAHNNYRSVLPPAPDADTSMLKHMVRKLPPAHVHRKVSLLTEPIHGAQAHKLLYAATQTTKPTRPFLNPPPKVRNTTKTNFNYGPLYIFPNSKINQVNKLQISRQPGEAASKYMNLATPPPAHCNPVKSSAGGGRLNPSTKKRPLSVPRQNNNNSSNNSVVINNVVVRPPTGATEVKRPRLVSDYLTLANAPPKNPFVSNSVIQSGPNVAHRNNTITNSSGVNSNTIIRQAPPAIVSIPQQQQQQHTLTRTVIQPVPSAHSNYHTSSGSMTLAPVASVALAGGSVSGGSNALDFSKKALNFSGMVGMSRTIRGGIGGLEAASPIIISPQALVSKEEPVNLCVKRPLSLSTSTSQNSLLHHRGLPATTLFPALSPVIAAQPGATLIPMVAMPTNMVTIATTNPTHQSLGHPAASLTGSVMASGDRPGPGGDTGKLIQTRVVTPKTGDPPPLSPHVHPAFLNGTVQPQLVMTSGPPTSGGAMVPATGGVKVSLAMGQYILPLQQMQQLYSQAQGAGAQTQVALSMQAPTASLTK